MEYKIEYRERIDHKMLFVLISLVLFGLVMIYSIALSQGGLGLFKKQVEAMSVGLAGIFIFSRYNWDILFRNKYIVFAFYGVSIILILMLLAPEGISHSVNGATRWLDFKVCYFQVAEFVKIGVIFLLTYWIVYAKFRRSWKEEVCFILLGWIFGGVPAAMLLVISNDLSSAIVVLGITFAMTFLASRGKAGWIMHIGMVVLAIAVVIFAIVYVSRHMPSEQELLSRKVSFRIGRVAAWLHPEYYPKTTGYQPLHCLYAIANGGWFGRGLGQSFQKTILPESENDVIFAIIIEELGIFGAMVLLLLFAVLMYLIIKLIRETKLLAYRALCTGIMTHLMLQVMIHCGVCTNMIPNTGIGLPFISSGMSASLLQMAEMILVFSIAKVHIFNRYNMPMERVQDKQRLRTQRFFVNNTSRRPVADVEGRRITENVDSGRGNETAGRENRGIGAINRRGNEATSRNGSGRGTKRNSAATARSRSMSGTTSRSNRGTTARNHSSSATTTRTYGNSGSRGTGRTSSVTSGRSSSTTNQRTGANSFGDVVRRGSNFVGDENYSSMYSTYRPGTYTTQDRYNRIYNSKNRSSNRNREFSDRSNYKQGRDSATRRNNVTSFQTVDRRKGSNQPRPRMPR